MKCKRLITASLLAGLVCLAPVNASAEVMELNFQSCYIGPHIINLQAFQPWVAELEKKTDGQLKMHFFMSGAIMKPDDVVPSLMLGSLDAGAAGVTYQDTQFAHSVAFTLPHLTRNSKHSSALYWKAYETIPEIKAELDKPGKVLTMWGSDRSGIFSTKGPMLSPADVKGKRVLIWNGGQVDQVKSWGGIPVQVSPNDTYLSLERGVGDLFFGPLPTGVANKLMEVAKDVTILPATVIPIVVWMNWEIWDSMPADMQKIVYDSMGPEANTRYGQLLYDATVRDLDTMRAAGVKIHELSEAQYQTFQDADMPVLMAFWKKDLARLGVKDPEAWIKKIYDLSDSIPE